VIGLAGAATRRIRPETMAEITRLLGSQTVSARSIVDGILARLPPSDQTPAIRTRLETFVASGAGVPPLSATVVRRIEQIISEEETRVRDDTLDDLLRQSAIALAVMSSLSIVLGWLMAGRVMRPVHKITDAARRLSETSLDARLNLGGPNDELRELGDTFDSMLDRIQSAFENERRLIANTSHELRTPLANQRTLIDVTLSDADASTAELRCMAEKVRAQTIRNQELIDRLLLLGRIGHGVPEHTQVFLDDIVRRVGTETDFAGITEVRWDLESAAMAGDAVLLSCLASNLIENACRHNCVGGYVTIRTSSDRASETVQLIVENSGPDLADTDLDSLRLPFRRRNDRTNSSRGVGLGLSLVDSIAAAHRATMTMAALPVGGLRTTISFPAEPELRR
jgi:signal transduction histidine kinase